jgi:SAM-dependent methyltransferase
MHRTTGASACNVMNRNTRPPSQDPLKPEFWNKRFHDGVTPWDAGHVPLQVRDYIDRHRPCGRILIPGCGAAHEARAFADAGGDVLAIDFSPQAVAEALAESGLSGEQVRVADFFAGNPDGEPFDLVYERAFLCALPPSRHSRYAERMAELIRPGGRLIGYFYFDDHPGGPPFGASAEQLQRLLLPYFRNVTDAAATDSIPIFAGRERWQVWERMQRTGATIP